MYQVIARKFRPQTFKELLGQEAIVTTLKNSIRMKRLAHAYIFSGPRGTGKTSVARIFAKAINCPDSQDEEPCNKCASCLEIQSGRSLDVIEIDGASNRGIDDIRKINETAPFTTGTGNYKIYIIDEVHMLTKEAFNALLKTLEEPPPKVKFFFATTEPHKVIPTILSRCQRYQLNRIPFAVILQKLKRIAEESSLDVEEEALRLIAKQAEGGLRDAESLFDQLISFHEGKITFESVSHILGVPQKEIYFSLDEAARTEDMNLVLKMAHETHRSGCDLGHFLEGLIEHFRTLLFIKLGARDTLNLSEKDCLAYEKNHTIYSKEGCLAIIDILLDRQNKSRNEPLTLVSLESLLLKISTLTQAESIESIVKKLSALEEPVKSEPRPAPAPAPAPQIKNTEKPAAPATPAPPQSQPAAAPLPPKPLPSPPEPPPASAIIDPTPTKEDLQGIRPAVKHQIKPTPSSPSEGKKFESKAPVSAKTETLLQFAAVELEGKIIRN